MQAFTENCRKISESECARVISQAIDMGVTTLDATGGADAELLLGRALAGHREDALISVCGGGAPRDLAGACEAALRRLRTDYIDLFCLSCADQGVPVEDSAGTLGELVTAGKIRYLGLRDTSPHQLRLAHRTHAVSALAVEYSLLRRSPEPGVLATAAELGVGVVARCPLERGLLTGTSLSGAREGLRRILRSLGREAAELDLGMARLALAWLLAQRTDLVPVPSTGSVAHLEMNASVPGIRLGPGTRARLEALGA